MKGYVSIFIILFFLFSGCASLQKSEIIKPEISKTKEAEQSPGLEVSSPEKPSVAQPKIEEFALPKYERSGHEKPLPKAEPIDPKRLALEDRPVMINVGSMPLSDFVIYAIGDTLKVTFFIDEAVKNMKTPVTLRMTQEMPAARALEIAIEVLRVHDLIVEEKAGVLYILKARQPPRQPADIRVGRTAVESPAQIVQIVPLRHIRAGDAISLITEIYKTNVTVRPYISVSENALLLTGTASSIKDILDFIDTVDVPYLKEKKLFLFQLTYWQIDEFIKQMTTILEGLGFPVARTPRDPGILFIPIKYLNSLLVVSPDEDMMRLVLDWEERLDTAESAGTEEKAFTYSPKYSKASDLVDAIMKLHGVLPQAKKTEQATSPKPETLPKVAGLKIAADDRRNVVVIITTPATYKVILSLLTELDRAPRQVLIEAMVAELTLNEELRYGLEWYIKNRMVEGGYTLKTLGQLGLTTTTGMTYQFISDTQKFQALINAFAAEGKINILSSPRLMVLDNEEATIQIGTDIPVVVGEVTRPDITAPGILRNIQYRNTGVILRVRPNINTEGLLTLNISQEVSEMGANPPGIASPTILVRRINTTVVAVHGKNIVLGGLMSEKISSAESKVPLLGDIPLLGHLFKTTTQEKTKTELIILLTPTILTSVDEAVNLTKELKQGLKWLK